MSLSTLGPDLLVAAQDIDAATVEMRRLLHAEPELGLQLPETQKKILDSLTGLGMKITPGRSTTSVVADLDSGKPGPTILLRGDMDALPLQEDNPIAWRSKKDLHMHACGHDSHVAMLLSAAHLLAKNTDSFNGKIRFMFQPGEEGFHGAKFMIEEGVLDGVDRAFAIHVITQMESGKFYAKGGPLMASSDEFNITIKGRGGHASMPAGCIDPIPAAAQTVLGLHAMTGRVRAGTDPAVLTVAHMEAGTTYNIIPEVAKLQGTIRTLNEDTRALLKERLETVASHTAQAHGCSCETHIKHGYPVTVNNDQEVERAQNVCHTVFGEGSYIGLEDAVMGAEDWSYVLENVPGMMAFLGCAPKGVNPAEAAPNHSNYMEIDEDAMANGVAMYAAMAMARD